MKQTVREGKAVDGEMGEMGLYAIYPKPRL